MDQELGWWIAVVFGGWQDRHGPRYQRLAAALLDAVDRGLLTGGTRVLPERELAGALGVSRGTVAACCEHLVAAGVLGRRQGSGTYVLGRPSWAARPSGSDVATLLLRQRVTADTVIDLSVSSPGDLRHLPPVDVRDAWAGLDGHGLDPDGLPSLRAAIADHLTRHQHLPTDPAQIVVTSGAQEALRLLATALRPDTLVATCPTYPGLLDAFGPDRRVVPLPLGPSGPDPDAVERAARSVRTLVYLMPTGHNPVGHVLPARARHAIAAIADRAEATFVEDLALADLHLGPGPAPPPLAALSAKVVAVGSVAKLLWGGLRIGWIRAGEPLRSTLIAAKPVAAAVSQAVTARLLAGVDEAWLTAHRTALARRRDHLAGLIADRLPEWRVTRPAAGLSMWVEVPVADVAAFAHTAARHGVLIAPGATACVDHRHHQFTRLSFAEQFDTLTLAVDRLAEAWRSYGGGRDDNGDG